MQMPSVAFRDALDNLALTHERDVSALQTEVAELRQLLSCQRAPNSNGTHAPCCAGSGTSCSTDAPPARRHGEAEDDVDLSDAQDVADNRRYREVGDRCPATEIDGDCSLTNGACAVSAIRLVDLDEACEILARESTGIAFSTEACGALSREGTTGNAPSIEAEWGRILDQACERYVDDIGFLNTDDNDQASAPDANEFLHGRAGEGGRSDSIATDLTNEGTPLSVRAASSAGGRGTELLMQPLASSDVDPDFEEITVHDVRWGRIVTTILVISMKPLAQLKPVWVQSDTFLKRMARANPDVDLTSIRYLRDYDKTSYTERSSRAVIVEFSQGLSSFTCGSLKCPPVMDPSSKHRIAWSVLGIIFMVYDLVMIPMSAFDLPDEPGHSVGWVTQVFWSLDIIISFLTGVHIGNELEMRFRKIARHYLTTWFAIDAVVTVPLWWELIMTGEGGRAGANAKSVRAVRYARVLRFLRLARLIKFEARIQEALEVINSSSLVIVVGIVRLMLYMIILNHIVACLWYSVGKAAAEDGWVQNTPTLTPEDRAFYRYLVSVHWTFTQFQGTSEISPGKSGLERGYAVLTVMFFLIVLACFVSRLTNMMLQLENLQAQRTYENRVVRGYLSGHNISVALSVRVKKYLMWKQKLSKSILYDSAVLDVLPRGMIMDLDDEVRSPWLSEHTTFFAMFREAYPRIVRRLCHEAMDVMFGVPGELIFTPLDECTRMYIVTSGVLCYTAVMPSSGKGSPGPLRQTRATMALQKAPQWRSNQRRASGAGDVATADSQRRTQDLKKEQQHQSIEKGVFMCEAILYTDWEHTGNFVADKASTLLRLDPDIFCQVVKTHQQAVASIVYYARRFVAGLNRFGKSYTDYIDDETLAQMLEGTEDLWDDDNEEPSTAQPDAPKPQVRYTSKSSEHDSAKSRGRSTNKTSACVRTGSNGRRDPPF